MKIGDINPNALAMAAGLGLGLVMLWQLGKLGKWATVDGGLNPASSNNVVNRGVQGLGAAVTGDEAWNLGTSLYEWLNPDAVAAERAAINGPAPTPTTAAGVPLWTLDGTSFSTVEGGHFYTW